MISFDLKLAEMHEMQRKNALSSYYVLCAQCKVLVVTSVHGKLRGERRGKELFRCQFYKVVAVAVAVGPNHGAGDDS